MSGLLDNLNKLLSSNINEIALDLSIQEQGLKQKKFIEMSSLDIEDRLNSSSKDFLSHIDN